MNTSAEAADQVVRMTLNGVEVAAKITGAGAKELATLLYAVLKDQKKTAGKTRLSNMLRSGKELKVFAVKDQDLQKFCEEAKKYGVLYCVLRDKNAKDGLTDIMVPAEDAAKVNRIFERFNLATVDMGAVRAEIERKRAEQASEVQPPERSPAEKTADAQFVDQLLQPAPSREEAQTQNPTEGRNAKSRQSEPTSRPKKSSARGDSDTSDRSARPSVRQELSEIRDGQRQKAEAAKGSQQRQQPAHQHKAPSKKPKKAKER